LPKTTTEKMELLQTINQNKIQIRYQPAKLDRERVIRKFAEDVANGNIPGEYN
jgi:hypothetical protein